MKTMPLQTPAKTGGKPIEELPHATIRFAGDSGDGMQLTGVQFTNSSAVFGNDVSTLPDFPAEIRAPAGTVYGVSGFQLQFSSSDIYTPGDEADTLVAMNPAALRVNIDELRPGGIIIANEDGFTPQNLKLAGYDANPLTDGSLSKYRVHSIPMTQATVRAIEDLGVVGRDAARCKNFFALGVVCWLYSRPLDPIIEFIDQKFARKETIREANLRTLKAGYYLGETQEMFDRSFRVAKAKLPPGVYREVHGNTATALGLVTASRLANKDLFCGSYPITPATDILHDLAKYKEFGVRTFQAEDEIAAIGAAIGASFGGAIGVTASAGPGIALKAEAMGLAVMMELPLVVINVQRGGPSTGLPTKVEQADLMQVLHGRNGESPIPVLAPRSSADCFDMAIMAVRIAIKYMTPVVLLSDGYIANSAEPWMIPDVDSIEPIEISHPTEANGDNGAFLPYLRDEFLARPWALPGTPGLMHRIGGLEKKDITGTINYEPENHQRMVNLRQAKVSRIAEFIPEQKVYNDPEGNADVLLVGWGSTYGSIREANRILRHMGHKVANIHLRYLNPFPRNLGEIMERYRGRRIIVPELNNGQLLRLLRAEYLVDARGLNKVQGRPFTVQEIVEHVDKMLRNGRNGA